MKNLSKEIQDLIISVYSLGYDDGDSNLPKFNNQPPIEYIEACLNPINRKEDFLELIDSVS
jgi:hypothetical protein